MKKVENVFNMRGIYLIITLLILLACKKHRAKKIAGDYACVVDFHYQDISPKYYDSIFSTTLNVSSKGRSVNILKFEILADLIYRGEKYKRSISSHGWLEMQYKKKEDSLYFYWQDGGQGGYGSYNYKCKKLN